MQMAIKTMQELLDDSIIVRKKGQKEEMKNIMWEGIDKYNRERIGKKNHLSQIFKESAH